MSLQAVNTVFSINDFSNLCRTCLAQENLQSIFTVTFDGTPIAELLEKCISIQVIDCLINIIIVQIL